MRRIQLALAAFGTTAVLGWLTTTGGQTASAPHPARLLAANCFQCHGTNGRSVNGIDSLAGKSAAELYEELLEMRSRPANRQIMNVHAHGYTKPQLRAIADYFSRQRP
jgi:sulfide dehydrogenase cytochrome subunit